MRYWMLTLACMAGLITAAAHAKVDKDVEQRIAGAIAQLNPQLKADSITQTPVPGLYEVVIGRQLLYFSADGRYLLQGELIDVKEQRSLTEQRRQQSRVKALESVVDDEMIVYPARGETRHRVTVFTDIDCPYCRRLHTHMSELNERGIEVRYIQMPRAGINSESYRKAVSVFCANDSLAAMDDAKSGGNPPTRECDNPVRQHLLLASELGINATPTLIAENGALHAGYLEPDEMLRFLEQR